MSSAESPQSADGMRTWVLAASLPVIALTVMFVALRVYSRRLQGQKLWWDDKVIIFSTVWFLVICILGVVMFVVGVGLHAAQIGHERDVLIAKLMLAAEVLYGLNLCWTKIGILLMYWRIFNQAVAYFRPASYAIGGLVLAWGVVITFASIFLCVPVQKSWDPTVPGRCLNVLVIWTANAASTILTDIAILALPLPKVWKLHLRTVQKVALTFSFALGFFVVFVSTYRFIILSTYQTDDASYTYAPIAVWSLIEIAAGLISSCLPLLGPVANLGLRHVGIQNGLGSFIASRTRPTRNKFSYHKKSAGGLSTYGGGSSSSGGGGGGGRSRFLRSNNNDMLTLRDDLDNDGGVYYGAVAEAAAVGGDGGGQMHDLAEFQTLPTTPTTPKSHTSTVSAGGIWDGSAEMGATALEKKQQGRVITKKLRGPGVSPRLPARGDRALFERLPDVPPVAPLGGIEVRQEFGVVALPRKFTEP